MSKIYCNPTTFVPTLLSLISNNRYKIVEVSEFNILDIRINFNKYPMVLDKTRDVIKIKTGNKIRSPKKFEKFIDTFIETKLIKNSNLLPGEIIVKETHPYSSYIEETTKKVSLVFLISQQGALIVTQKPNSEPIVGRGLIVQSYNRIYKV